MYLETESIPYGLGRSFASIWFEGPTIICPFHRHPELELVWLDAGTGRMVAGDFAGSYRPGEIYLLGANIPHIFQVSESAKPAVVRTHVIQFREDFCGGGLFDVPEFRSVKKMLALARRGLKIRGNLRKSVQTAMRELHESPAARKIPRLLDLLILLSESRAMDPLSRAGYDPNSLPHDGRMSVIMAYIQENLFGSLSVPEAARRAGLSPNALCRYFKRQTRRTFTDVVNELRVGEACRLLEETTLSVTDVAFASGFCNLAHFYAEFRRRNGISPGRFRANSE